MTEETPACQCCCRNPEGVFGGAKSGVAYSHGTQPCQFRGKRSEVVGILIICMSVGSCVKPQRRSQSLCPLLRAFFFFFFAVESLAWKLQKHVIVSAR